MKFIQAILIQKDSELSVRLSEMEKPQYRATATEEECDKFKHDFELWEKSKEYPVKEEDKDKVIELSKYNYLNNVYMLHPSWYEDIKQGIPIDINKIELECKNCKMDIDNHTKYVGCQNYANPSYEVAYKYIFDDVKETSNNNSSTELLASHNLLVSANSKLQSEIRDLKIENEKWLTRANDLANGDMPVLLAELTTANIRIIKLEESIQYYFDVLREVRGEDWDKKPDHVLGKMLNAMNKL